MPVHLASVSPFIENASTVAYWKLVENTWQAFDKHAMPQCHATMQTSELADVDPRLPEVFELFARNNKVQFAKVLCQLAHWHNAVPVPYCRGQQRFVAGVVGIDHVDKSHRNLRMDVLTYLVSNKARRVGSSADGVYGARIGKINVSYDWLEQHFPAWETRHAIASAIDEIDEVTSYLFPMFKATGEPAQMLDITGLTPW